MSNKFLAIDASLSSTGYALMVDGDITLVGRVTTKSKEDEDGRVLIIAKHLMDICINHRINTIIIEDQYLRMNPKTSMQLSRLRGAIVAVLGMLHVKAIYYTASEIKKTVTGNGAAKKDEVANEVLNTYKNNKTVTNIGPFIDGTGKNKTSDMYDAVAIAMCHNIIGRGK